MVPVQGSGPLKVCVLAPREVLHATGVHKMTPGSPNAQSGWSTIQREDLQREERKMERESERKERNFVRSGDGGGGQVGIYWKGGAERKGGLRRKGGFEKASREHHPHFLMTL